MCPRGEVDNGLLYVNNIKWECQRGEVNYASKNLQWAWTRSEVNYSLAYDNKLLRTFTHSTVSLHLIYGNDPKWLCTWGEVSITLCHMQGTVSSGKSEDIISKVFRCHHYGISVSKMTTVMLRL